MVSERERGHFERIAEAAREHAVSRLSEELRRPAMQRLLEGLMLGAAAVTSPAVEQALEQRALGQAELHRRARRLGLIR